MRKLLHSKLHGKSNAARRVNLYLAVPVIAALAFINASPIRSQSSDTLHSTASVEAQRLFSDRHLAGAVVAQNVRTGSLLASFSSDSTTTFLPLSIVKLFLFASYLEHREALPATISADPHELIAVGSDSAGRQLALAMRHKLGSRELLRDLARFGFPGCNANRKIDCTALSRNTADADWADAMSIGEANFHVSLLGLSRFLVAVGNQGIVPGKHPTRMLLEETARQLQIAMLDTVQIGTASGIRERLGSAGKIGGKTGSGPGDANPTDGIFAALIFDHDGVARYAVVTYVRRGGHGGGAAAEISADLAKFLLGAVRN